MSNEEAKEHFERELREGKEVTFPKFMQYWKMKLAPGAFKLAIFNYSIGNY